MIKKMLDLQIPCWTIVQGANQGNMIKKKEVRSSKTLLDYVTENVQGNVKTNLNAISSKPLDHLTES